MADNNKEKKETELLATYPWQRMTLILISAIAVLFSGLMYAQKAALQDTKDQATERVSYLQMELDLKNKTIAIINAEKDSCNSGTVRMVTQMLNRELAIKLSSDTSKTVKKIVESLIKTSEAKDKQGGNKP